MADLALRPLVLESYAEGTRHKPVVTGDYCQVKGCFVRHEMPREYVEGALEMVEGYPICTEHAALFRGALQPPLPDDHRTGQGQAQMPPPHIDKPYAYHKPSTEGLEKITRLRTAFSEVEKLMKEVCPPSRHLSHAITCNETTAMWSIKAVVFNDPASEVE